MAKNIRKYLEWVVRRGGSFFKVKQKKKFFFLSFFLGKGEGEKIGGE